MLTNRRFQVTIVAALVVVASLYGFFLYRYNHDPERLGYENIPAEGVAANDTNGLIAGNPENGTRALRNFYKFALIYKSRHGLLPAQCSELFGDVSTSPEAYGIKGSKDLLPLLGNPDNKFADNGFGANVVGFAGDAARPDGTKVFSAKEAGTKDVLAYSDTYVHENIRTFPGEKSTSNPVGFYQVLWDDGTTQQIPYDQIRFVLKEQQGSFRSYDIAFPGQAGVPANSLSYDERYRKAGWTKAPRGGAGKPGLDYQGKRIGKS